MVIYLGYSLRNSLKRHFPPSFENFNGWRDTALHQAGFFAFRLSRGGRVPLRAGHFSPFVLVRSKTSIVSVTLSVSRKFLRRPAPVSLCRLPPSVAQGPPGGDF